MDCTITGTGVVTPESVASPPIAALLEGERLRSLNAETKLLLAAARLALRDAGLTAEDVQPDDLGVVVATRHAGLRDYVELFLSGTDPDRPHVNPARGPLTGLNAPAALLSIRLGAAGPNVTISNGTVGGLDALRCAADALATERARAMLVCGVDVAPAIARPPGEPAGYAGGAAVVVLEAARGSRPRPAGACAGVAGVATAHSPSGDLAEASERALRGALREAGVARDAVQAGSAPAEPGEAEAIGAVAQLARAAAGLRRPDAGGPVLVSASDEPGSAGTAVLVGVSGRERRCSG